MTELEDRLREELSQLAALAQPETIRPLRDPAQRRRSPAARFLAPVAAMVAVAAVAVAVALIAPGLHDRSGSVPDGPALVRTHTVPRFYMLAYQSYVDGGHKIATYAAVHSSATGATLARVTLPTLWYQGGAYSPSITAAASDRTFVVMESNLTSLHDIVWLFRLQVSASGRAIRVIRLPLHVPPTVAIDDVALSPDGTRLEMTAQWDCGHRTCQDTGIRVVNLATDATTIWSTRVQGAPFNGSWVGDNAVAFEWQPNARGEAANYRVLPLSGKPADLLTASTPVASPRAESNYYVPNALVTPDGRTVVTSQVTPYAHWFVHGAVARIVELNAHTGRLERTLYVTSAHGESGNLDQECNVLSLGPGGRHPLVDCFAKLGALVNGQIVSLPGIPSPSSSGIAGQQAIAW
jgi:hypothetical protein